MKTAIVTVGLGFGDEAKGATVDYLCRRFAADLVVRYCGGSQCGHNVELPDGRRHTFAQFGSGTLAGVPTYLGPEVVINPTALVREADHLVELGVADPYATLTIHPAALVSTVDHQCLNQGRELAAGAGRHGSCGHGIGETRRYDLERPGRAIRAADLVGDGRPLCEKLDELRRHVLGELAALGMPADVLPPVDAVGRTLREVGQRLRLEPRVPDYRTAIFEGAQGVLLDEWAGFHPHTTWSTVTLEHAHALARESRAEHVCNLGLTRAFTTRHGAGPLPTSDAGLTERLSDPGNPANRWQGSLRVGWLDLVLLRYAIAAAGGTLDGLAVSWLDRVDDAGFRVCRGYEGLDLPEPGPGRDLARQERLGRQLRAARPVYAGMTRGGLLDELEGLAPVVLTSQGPTFRDRHERAGLAGVVEVSGGFPGFPRRTAGFRLQGPSPRITT